MKSAIIMTVRLVEVLPYPYSTLRNGKRQPSFITRRRRTSAVGVERSHPEPGRAGTAPI